MPAVSFLSFPFSFFFLLSLLSLSLIHTHTFAFAYSTAMQQQQQQQRVSLHRGSSCPSLLATMPTATTTAHGYSSISLASDLYGHHSVDSQRVSMSSLIDPHQHNDQQQQQQQHHHHHHPHRRSSPTGSCHHLQQCPLTEENLKQHTLKVWIMCCTFFFVSLKLITR